MHVIGICYHSSVITAKRRFYLYERSLLFLSFYTHVTSILGSWYMSQSFIILQNSMSPMEFGHYRLAVFTLHLNIVIYKFTFCKPSNIAVSLLCCGEDL